MRGLKLVRCTTKGAHVLKDFKKFAVRGNVVDMAVGIIIGAAFTGLVKSLVEDVITPPLSLLSSGADFTDRFIVLRGAASGASTFTTLAEAKAAGATVLAYGLFLNALITFASVALALFFVIRWINALRSPDTPPAPSTKTCPFCMSTQHERASRCSSCTSDLSAPLAERPASTPAA